MKVALTLILAASTLATVAQTPSSEWNLPKPGVKEVQVSFASLKPSATIKIGGTADWALVTDDAVWVASTKPYAVLRIDPSTNKILATIKVPGEACSGLASGFGSIWVPLCGKKSSLVRVDATKNLISVTLPIPPAGSEGGITASEDSVWIVSDKNGTLNRIDPSTKMCARKSRYHPVPTTRFSVMALSGSPESRAASSLPWKPLLAKCWSRCLSGRSLAFLLLVGVLFGRSTKGMEPSAGLMKKAGK